MVKMCHTCCFMKHDAKMCPYFQGIKKCNIQIPVGEAMFMTWCVQGQFGKAEPLQWDTIMLRMGEGVQVAVNEGKKTGSESSVQLRTI